jgi:lipid II:glycine glycyltransferase (peptidoglycan interpeptide bridge formation enzyme)
VTPNFEPTTPQQWNAFTIAHPQVHLLQTTSWGELKSAFGWEAGYLANGEAGAQILLRPLPLGFHIAYIPMGPIGNWLPAMLPSLDDFSRQHRCILLKVEPDADWNPQLAERLAAAGFRPSPHSVQPRATIQIDITPDEDQILGAMKQKTRYNIRLAGRKDVRIRPWDNLDGFSHMMIETGERDEFGAHSRAYFQKAYDLFHPQGACELLVAEYEGEPLAAVMVFARGHRAWYLYGASTDAHRNRMPTYLLQWEAIRWARSRGCTVYDLWGIPEADEETLEEQFTQRSDGLWGVYRFKRGFGGQVKHSMGAWDRVYNPWLYRLYSLWVQRGQA